MITEDLSAFLKDFGQELEFFRESTESSSSSSAVDESVLTSTFILDEPESDVKIYDRSFFDAKVYKATLRTKTISLLGVEAELTSLAENDYTLIDAVRFYVVGRIPGESGYMSVILSKQAVRPE